MPTWCALLATYALIVPAVAIHIAAGRAADFAALGGMRPGNIVTGRSWQSRHYRVRSSSTVPGKARPAIPYK